MLDLSIWTRLNRPVYLDLSAWTRLFKPSHLDPSIWTSLFGPVDKLTSRYLSCAGGARIVLAHIAAVHPESVRTIFPEKDPISIRDNLEPKVAKSSQK